MERGWLASGSGTTIKIILRFQCIFPFQRKMNRVFFVCFILFLACGRPSQKVEIRDDLFTEGETLGKVGKRLEEASGLVASLNNVDHYWSHNDSGNPPEIFLIDQQASIKLICRIEGIKNRDWEDIAIGAGPKEGMTYVYIGDIGDNRAEYPVKFIYRFEEPVFTGQTELIISDYDTLIVKLPDAVRDSEALTIDPISNDMILVSKREDSVRVYQVNYYKDKHDTLLAQRIAILPLHNINAADVSANGMEVLMKDYDRIYYWKRESTESIGELLSKKPIRLPYRNGPQDEAIAWKRDGSGFFTLGETVKGNGGNLVLHKRK